MKFRVFLAVLCFAMSGSLAQAQLTGFEGHTNRVIGSEPPVIEAVLDQDLEALQRLWLKDRPRYQDRGRQGRTALITAAMIGNHDILEYLITKEALLEAGDDNGNTALHYAAAQGHVDIVASLIDADANMNSANHNGEVPMFMAARQGHWSVLELLLDCGADTEVTDYTARGLMDYARMSKDRSIARKLRKYL